MFRRLFLASFRVFAFSLPTRQRFFKNLFFQRLCGFILVLLAVPGFPQGQLHRRCFRAERRAHCCFSILGYVAAVLALSNLGCTILELLPHLPRAREGGYLPADGGKVH